MLVLPVRAASDGRRPTVVILDSGKKGVDSSGNRQNEMGP
jgi:hypothetical protein